MNPAQTQPVGTLLSKLGPRLLQAARLAVLAHLARQNEPLESRAADSQQAAVAEGGER